MEQLRGSGFFDEMSLDADEVGMRGRRGASKGKGFGRGGARGWMGGALWGRCICMLRPF